MKLLTDHPCDLGFPRSSFGKASASNAGDLGSIPGSGKSPGEGKGYPLQHSGLENSMDCIVHGVTKSQTRLSDFYFTFLESISCSIWAISPSLYPNHSVSGACLSLK